MQKDGMAWHSVTHSWFAEQAFSSLPEDAQRDLAPYRSAIIIGAQFPLDEDQDKSYWNIHAVNADESGAAPDYITQLYNSILLNLRSESPDLAAAAYQLGMLAHAVSDLRFPLHTDVEARETIDLQEKYQIDSLLHMTAFRPNDLGAQFWTDPQTTSVTIAGEANHLYSPVLDAYGSGRNYEMVANLTAMTARKAIEDIVNVWSTIWALSVAQKSTLSLHVNQAILAPGDTFQLTLYAANNKSLTCRADMYVAMVNSDGETSFFGTNNDLHSTATPYIRDFSFSDQISKEILNIAIPPSLSTGEYFFYALLVATESTIEKDENWLSNLAVVSSRVEPSAGITLGNLRDEEYLFPGKLPNSEEVVALPLRRWDFVFLGQLEDNPDTPKNEQWTDALIPGQFNHAMVYLGRDQDGRPWGLEMTTTLDPDGADLRIVRFPEFETVRPEVEDMNLAMGPKNIWKYGVRWAKRIREPALDSLHDREAELLQLLQDDWESAFPYQLEFDWSGSLQDLNIQLVDDGRAGGSSCTDYWLDFYENNAGVCFSGSRINASEIEAYFRFDPVGMTAYVPEEFSPFPFPITVVQALEIGFIPVDPPSHFFPCSLGPETGVPIPDRLMASPELEEISSVPAPPFN